MTKDELLERLRAFEWNDIEFKKAQSAVPDDAYLTVSAFANTGGGWLLFGIGEADGGYEVVGVTKPDKIQNDFLGALRSGKLSRTIEVRAERFEIDGKVVLAFFIPESRRQDKPVSIGADPLRCYIRRGGGDEKCNKTEIERFLRDASNERYDGGVVDLDPEHFFHPESVAWYRRLFEERNPGQIGAVSDLEFLNEVGFVIEASGKLHPMRAAILLCGTRAAVARVIPRPVVDLRWIHADSGDVIPDQRWDDRLVIEDNLLAAWRAVVDRYSQHAERPFRIDPTSLRRTDDPPEYMSFREAAINLLIHQDFSDHSRHPVIEFFRDRTRLWNPGDAFSSLEDLAEAGDKDVRNPRIAGAFRRIGLGEQAGTGIRAILRSWQQLGWLPPRIVNDRGRKTFELVFLREQLLSEQQLVYQARLGVHLSDHEARVFALVTRQGSVTLREVKLLTGLSDANAQNLLKRLVAQVLLSPVDSVGGSYFVLAEHLAAGPSTSTQNGLVTDQPADGPRSLVSDQPPASTGNLVTDQPTPPTLGLVTPQPVNSKELTDTQRRLVTYASVWRSLSELMNHVGLTHRTFFKRQHLARLIDDGIIQMKHPESPNHPEQAYRLTDAGLNLWRAMNTDGRPDEKA